MAIISEITLRDNYTATAGKVTSSIHGMERAMNSVSKKSSSFSSVLKNTFDRTYTIKIKDIKSKEIRKDVQKLQSTLRSATGKPYKVSVTAKTSAFSKIKSDISSVSSRLKKFKVNTTSLLKAKAEARRLSKELTKTTGKKHKIKIDMDKKPLSILDRIKRKLKGLKGGPVEVPIKEKGGGMFKSMLGANLVSGMITGGVGMAKDGLTSMFNSGAELETQKISMKHFLGGDEKKSDAYLKSLRREANITPFSTGEIVEAGTRAIGITGGDVGKANQLVKMAEDMAALNPGKNVTDAMEALARAQMGEMRGLREFKFQGSAKEFEKAGGDIFKMKDKATGKTLSEKYAGGAEKLSKSATGRWSTVKGQLQSGVQDAGYKMLEKLSPVFEKLIPVTESLAEKFPAAFDTVYNALAPFGAQIMGIGKSIWDGIQPLLPVLSNLVSAALPVFGAVLSVVGSVIKNFVVPAFSIVGSFIKGVLIPAFTAVGSHLSGVLTPIFDALGKVMNAVVIPAFDLVARAVQKVIEAFDQVVGAVGGFVKGLGGGISKFMGKVGSIFSSGGGDGGARVARSGGISRAVPEHATGTSYFGGGLTSINERGPELIQLSRGARIYPAGESKKIIQNETKKSESKNVSNTFNISITSTDPKGAGEEVEKRLRRLAVNMA